MDKIINKLYEYEDKKYRDFSGKLIPNISKDKIIGVRVPILRSIAKELSIDSDIELFLNDLPHTYQEENLLHALILSNKYKEIYVLLNKLDIFLEYADNWAVTDMISPKLFKKYPDIVYEYIKKWLNSNSEYKIRFAIVTLLQFYLDDNYNSSILSLVEKVNYDSYYVFMALAWFYSFALIKQYDDTIKIFENKRLERNLHNKSIQKALESYRITQDKKEYLRSLKVK